MATPTFSLYTVGWTVIATGGAVIVDHPQKKNLTLEKFEIINCGGRDD